MQSSFSALVVLCCFGLLQGAVGTARATWLEHDLRRSLLNYGEREGPCVGQEQQCARAIHGTEAKIDFDRNSDCGDLELRGVEIIRSLTDPNVPWQEYASLKGSSVVVDTGKLSPGFYLLELTFSDGSSFKVDLYVYNVLYTPTTLCLLVRGDMVDRSSSKPWTGHLCSCI
mmetsp:Transcript_29163/g.82234  ORF Transcript_29163/g.82234 Transcript_29163/m.82234 type:complete len:171 (+) Transcript_29163:439-951(+)